MTRESSTLCLWRITRAEFADSILSGIGGLYAAGRWHHQGLPVLYLASTWSLAALEVLVHIGRNDSVIAWAYVSVEIPDTIKLDSLPSLPKQWAAQPPQRATQTLGTRWLKSQSSVLLEIPSAISPVESNYLLNPQHPDIAKLRVSKAKLFRFDERLKAN